MFQLAAFADEADGSLIGQINAMQDNDIPLLEIRGVDGINVSDLSIAQAKEIRKNWKMPKKQYGQLALRSEKSILPMSLLPI